MGDTKARAETICPGPGRTREVGICGAEKDNFSGSLIDQDQLPFRIEATGL